jgi:uncharacterized membrane protein
VASVITVSGDIVGDVLIVVGMVVVEIFLLTRIIPRSGPPATLALMVIGTSELLGSAGLLMALVGAFFQSNLTTYTVVLFMFNFMMLTPPGLWVIAVIIYHDRRIDTTSWFWPVAIVTLATTAEVLMGLLFTVVSGSTPTIPVVLAGTLNSAWYFWSMGAAMVALLVWVRFEPIVRYPLLGLAGSAAVAPWVVVDPVAGALLMAGVMTVTYLGCYSLLRSTPQVTPTQLRVVLSVVGAFLAMTAGGFAVAVAGASIPSEILFGSIMSVVMVAEFLVLVREGLHPELRRRAELDLVAGVPGRNAAEVGTHALPSREA